MSDSKKSPLKVIPIRKVEHKNFSDLIGIRGHRNYYVNLLSGKITYISKGQRIPTGCTTIMSAKTMVEEYQRALSTGQSIQKIKRDLKGITADLLDDIWAELVQIKSVGKEDSTIKNYAKSWNHGLAFFWSGKTVLQVTDSNVEEYKKEYLKRTPTRNFEQSQVHLNMLFRYALKKGYIVKLPDMSVLDDLHEMIRKNSKWEAPGRVYSESERNALLREADNLSEFGRLRGTTSEHKELLASRAKLGILLGLVGLRKSEALGLLWEKIDYRKKIIKVWSFKNHQWRDVPMTLDISTALKIQKKHCVDSKFVFPMPSNPEQQMSSQIFDKVWVQVKKNAKISDWNVENKARFHDLRHTFATLTAELGWPPKVACDVLDMSLELYDNRYSHPSGAKKSEWMAKTFAMGTKP